MLVDPSWVVTAASCFADDPAQPTALQAGVPKQKTTVTVGRNDLATGAGGHITEIAELLPRTDRDLVMARLAQPAPAAVAPVALATTAPAPGEDLVAAGYGRTRTTWANEQLHTAVFTAGTVKPTGLNLAAKTADAAICKGDTGGPALRQVNGHYELAAVHSRSWQGGCLGTPATETRTGAYDTRTDDITPWIRETSRRGYPARDAGGRAHFTQTVAADFTGDGKADIIARDTNGRLYLWKHGAGDGFDWPLLLTEDWNYTETTAADVTGDGKADLIARDSAGNLNRWTGLGDGTFTRAAKLTGDWNYTQTTAADYNGDHKTDLIARDANGNLLIWAGLGDGTFTRSSVLTGGWKYTQTVSADLNGDGQADLLAADSDGTLHSWMHNPNGSFNAATSLTTGWKYTQTAAADVTGDGKPDLVACDDTNGNLLLWTGDGNGAFNRPTVLTSGW
ncbi:trypsin-like serine protease [Kitasatospora aburaviensis]